MPKPRRYRWICAECGSAKLGSSRPKKEATIRFCLPCSENSGELVRRECPALGKARIQKEERERAANVRKTAAKRRRKAKARAKREETAEAKWHYGGYDLRVEMAKMLQAARDAGYPAGKPTVSVRWRHRGNYTTGISYKFQRYIALTIPKGSPAAPALALLAHELAHQATPTDSGHGDDWRWCFKAILVDVYGVGALEPASSRGALHSELTKALGAALAEALTLAQLETTEEDPGDA